MAHRDYFFLALQGEDPDFFHQFTTADGKTVESPAAAAAAEINPNQTLGELIEKNISPPGMTPTWTAAARAKYEACVSPHIASYRFAVEKINREAMKNYHAQTYTYISTSVGIAGLTELFGVFRGDEAVRARWSWSGAAKRGIGANRMVFWITFIGATSGYIYFRMEFLEAERIDFIANTNLFFSKVAECRANNPYDMWRLKSPREQYLEELKFTPNKLIHPPRKISDIMLNQEKTKWLFLPK